MELADKRWGGGLIGDKGEVWGLMVEGAEIWGLMGEQIVANPYSPSVSTQLL